MKVPNSAFSCEKIIENPATIILHLLPLLTRKVIKSGGDVFGGVSVRRVADHQAGFTHRSVPEKDALQQPLLRLPRLRGHGTVRGHRGSHGVSVIHGDKGGGFNSNQMQEPALERGVRPVATMAPGA